MKRIALLLGLIGALVFGAQPALATPTAAASIDCHGRFATAAFTYTANANGYTAVETVSSDTQVSTNTIEYGTEGATDFVSVAIARDGKPHTVTAHTVVSGKNGQTAEASATFTCSSPPPPCQVNCGPPPCKTNCGPPPCKVNCNPPPPCVGCTPPPPDHECGNTDPDDPDCLPHTGPAQWWEERGTEVGILAAIAAALIGSGLYLRRRYAQSS